MEIFQKAVLIGSIILLIVILVFIGFLLRHSANNVEWPPTSASCPDNWQIQGTTGGTGSTGAGYTCTINPTPFIEAAGCTGCNVLYGSGCTFGGTGGTGACGVCQTNKCAQAPAPVAGCNSLVVPYDEPTSCQKYSELAKLPDTCQIAWDGVTYGVPNPCSDETAT